MSEELASEILKELKFMHSKFDEYDKKFDDINKKLDNHDIELRNLSKNIAKIEVEHGNKIDTLIDVTSGILERLDSLENKVESIIKIIDNHSDRIWNLESKVGII